MLRPSSWTRFGRYSSDERLQLHFTAAVSKSCPIITGFSLSLSLHTYIWPNFAIKIPAIQYFGSCGKYKSSDGRTDGRSPSHQLNHTANKQQGLPVGAVTMTPNPPHANIQHCQHHIVQHINNQKLEQRWTPYSNYQRINNKNSWNIWNRCNWKIV